MGVISDYYLNAPTLASATYVYLDALFTTPAPDGFYASNGVYRQVSGGLGELLAGTVSCPSCISVCPYSNLGFPNSSYYNIDLDVTSATGAVIITFNVRTDPHGIRATYTNSVYNALSSPVDGYHASTLANRETYLGDDTSACSISLQPNSPYAAISEYNWYDTSFYATGDTTNVFVAPGQVSFTAAAAPGGCVMVVPKTSSDPNIKIEVFSPTSCAIGTAISLSVACPIKLTPFLGSVSGGVCGDPINRKYYNAPVTGTLGSPALHDWIFEDVDGATPLPDGVYIFEDGANGTPHTIINGVVTIVGTPCP